MLLLLLLLAAGFEELGWRGYAFDSLRSRYSYLKAAVVFTQITKCIETVLLSVVAVALVALDKEVFPAKTGSRLFREGTIGAEMVDNG